MAPVKNAGGISMKILSTDDVLALEDETLRDMDEKEEINYDPLFGYIVSIFEQNRREKVDSGIEDEIIDSLKAYNGEYSAEDLKRIRQSGGSEIFMNLTATKSRAAKSWIADVLKPAKGKPWSLEPTPLEDLPGNIRELLTRSLQKEFEEMIASKQQPQPVPEGQQVVPSSKTEAAQQTIREANQLKRDIQRAVREEIHKESMYQLERMEQRITDQLAEGEWDCALGDFLDDFVVFPSAIMKGPIVQNSIRLVWREGQVQTERKYKFLNKRVHPLDIYPSPAATSVNDGNLCEHLRFTRADLDALRGIPEYHDEAIDKIIADEDMGLGTFWIDTSIEQDKAEIEGRSTLIDSTAGIIHGIHFWGDILIKQLQEWEFGPKMEELTKFKESDVVSIEAIIIGNHVVKCVLNDDPLKRRPYFKASFMNVPGAFWGKSLPMSMSSQQRMCNAVARALANNLGIASGPQIAIYIDRLADDGNIEAVYPFKIWQLKSDPTGAGGKAIDFWQPQSNARELLEVYNQFESKADDVTGIPKYAYGNENSSGMTQTAQGLAMLLETTSKIIKDCIRNIDDGLIRPRIMYQFHYNMINQPEDFNYTGDINVVTIGSGTLTVKGAEAAKRNEFLQATSNPIDMEAMGKIGRAEIIRKVGEDLGIPDVMPTTFELKQKQKKDEEAAAQARQEELQIEQQKAQVGLQATQMQVQAQQQMHQMTMQKDMQKIQADMKAHMDEMQIKMAELQRKLQETQAKLQMKALEEQAKEKRQTQEVALKIKEGSGI